MKSIFSYLCLLFEELHVLFQRFHIEKIADILVYIYGKQDTKVGEKIFQRELEGDHNIGAFVKLLNLIIYS